MTRPPASSPLVRLAMNSGLFYGWVIVAVVLLVSMVATGTRMASGVIIKPLEAEFGWDRAAISLALALGLLANGLGAPFGGRLIDRFGPRRVVVVALLVTIVATVSTVMMHTIVELTWWWGLVAGLSSGAFSTLGAVVANRWFIARRGLVAGLLGGGASAGQLVFIPLLMNLTVTIDWRAGLLLMVGLLVLMLPIALLVIRDRPASVGLEPYGTATASAAAIASTTRSTPLSTAIRTVDFWLLAGSFFVCGFTSTGIVGTHFIPHAIEYGFTEHVAANTLAVIGALNIVGTLSSGYLTDRFNPRLLLAIYYGLRATSLVMLPAISTEAGLWVFALVFGLDFIATVPPTIALTADRFGKASVGTIFGWIFCSHQFGSAVASWGAGVMRVYLGDYTMAFMAAAAVGFIGAALCPRIAANWKPEEEAPAPAPA
jgi:sugar phosphate permease